MSVQPNGKENDNSDIDDVMPDFPIEELDVFEDLEKTLQTNSKLRTQLVGLHVIYVGD